MVIFKMRNKFSFFLPVEKNQPTALKKMLKYHCNRLYLRWGLTGLERL